MQKTLVMILGPHAVGTYRLNSYDGEALPFAHYIKIDNTSLAPDTVARMMIDHFAIRSKT